MSSNITEKMKEMYSYSREDLKNKIHEIHNIIRNYGGGYGLDAMRLFIQVYSLGVLSGSKQGIDKHPDFDNKYSLENIYKKLDNYNKTKNEGDCIKTIKDMKVHIFKQFKPFFYNIPDNKRLDFYYLLFKKVKELLEFEENSNHNLSGKIYEYFIGRDKTARETLGAYFTDSYLTQTLVDNFLKDYLEEWKEKSDELPSFIDPFGGAGGMTINIVKKYNEIFNIEWDKESIKKINHCDMMDDVVRCAALEIYVATGQVVNPTWDINGNFKVNNTFADEFNNHNFDIVMTNQPFGGDKVKKDDETKHYENMKKNIEQMKKNKEITDEIYNKNIVFIKKKLDDKTKQGLEQKVQVKKGKISNRIYNFVNENTEYLDINKMNDKEKCGIALTANLLKKDGLAIAVLKEGNYFDKNFTQVREMLINNYNITDIIDVPQNVFENTTTKTSVIVFRNTEEKTSKINFHHFEIKKYEENKYGFDENNIYQILESKDNIMECNIVFDKTVPVDEIKENKIFSFNPKVYQQKETICGNDYEMKSIKNICDINSDNNIINKEKYKYVEIRNITQNKIISFTEKDKKNLPPNAKNTVKKNDILISCVRPNKNKIVLIDEDKYCEYIYSSALIKLSNLKYDHRYIYSVIYLLIDIFKNTISKGSTYPRFSPKDLEKISIPIPKTQDKIDYWVEKFSKASKNEKLYKQYSEELYKEALPNGY